MTALFVFPNENVGFDDADGSVDVAVLPKVNGAFEADALPLSLLSPPRLRFCVGSVLASGGFIDPSGGGVAVAGAVAGVLDEVVPNENGAAGAGVSDFFSSVADGAEPKEKVGLPPLSAAAEVEAGAGAPKENAGLAVSALAAG